jgi:lipopolysaccharide exporter
MAFLQIFADAGISNAIIHHQEISEEQLSSLYWLNVSASFSLALLLALLAPIISQWYGQPELQKILLITGSTLTVGAIGQQIRVLAQKNLRFEALAKIELSAALIGAVVAVIAAVQGWGVYSIVTGNFITTAVGCLAVWLRLAGGWRPQSRLNLHEIRHFLSFGAYMIGNNVANTVNLQMDVVLGGKMLGLQAIGLYSMPRDLNLRIAGAINPIITNVGLPIMAKAHEDQILLRRVYFQTMRMTASVNFPIYACLAIFAPEVVHILLGPKWQQAILLLRIFSVWGLVRSTGNPIGSLLMACGRADLSFRWNITWLFLTLPAILAGSYFGATGLAIAITSLAIIGYWPNWYFLVRPLCGSGFKEYSSHILTPLAISAATAIGVNIAIYFFQSDLIRLAVGVPIGIAQYLGLSKYFNGIWLSAMSELVGYRKSPGVSNA